jgi:hypothetical protein
MKKYYAQKWIKALRSGKYKQGKFKLYNMHHNTYCCLGVLNEIFPKLDLAGNEKSILQNYKKIGLNNERGYLCTANKDYKCEFTTLNDTGLCIHETEIDEIMFQPFTFDEIADIIQIEYIEGL